MKKRLFVIGVVGLLLSPVPFQMAPAHAATAPLLVDDFDGVEIKNRLGNRANVFMKAPSRIMATRREEVIQEKKTTALMLKYDKKNSGGPFDSGGWCGYYTLLKSPPALVAPTPDNPNPPPVEDQYLDITKYKILTFWVRGEKGDENFVVGLSDRHWDRIGDSVKSQEIGKYLPAGKITKLWQKAVIPLDEYFIDLTQIASIAVVFEGDLFPPTGHAGIVYVDQVVLEDKE